MGGQINLVAFGGGVSVSGPIIATGGGNVTIVGNGAINLGTIDTSGGTINPGNRFANGNGNIFISSAPPTVNAPYVNGVSSIGVFIDAPDLNPAIAGAIIGGFSDMLSSIAPMLNSVIYANSGLILPTTANTEGIIVNGDLITSGGDVTVRGAGNILLNNVTTTNLAADNNVIITNGFSNAADTANVTVGDISADSINAYAKGELHTGQLLGRGGRVSVSQLATTNFQIGSSENVEFITNIGTSNRTNPNITIVGEGDVTVSQALDLSTFSVTSGSNRSTSLDILAGGKVSLPDNIILTAADDGSAGSIFIQAETIAMSGSGQIQAISKNNSQGGFITIITSNLATPGGLSIDARGAGFGQGGNVEIYGYSSQAVNCQGNTIINANGGSQGRGGYIRLHGASLLDNVALSAHADGGLNANGGYVLIDSSVAGGTSLTLSGAGSITANGGGAGYGSGGMIEIYAARDLNIMGNDVITAKTGSLQGDGGGIYLGSGYDGSGILTVNGDISANGAGSGYGGTVWLEAPTTISSGGVVSHLSANGGSSGVGGWIHLQTRDQDGDINIGGPGSQFLLSATGGSAGSSSGEGGLIEVVAGGNLHVNGANALNVAALGNEGAGGWLFLNAGCRQFSYGFDQDGKFVPSYQLYDQGTLSISGGTYAVNGAGSSAGGVISLIAPTITSSPVATATAISLQAQGGSNVGGSASGAAGTVSIRSTGDINLDSTSINASAGSNSKSEGGTVDVIAGGSLSISSTTTPVAVIRADGGAKGGSGGTITLQSGGSATINNTIVSVEAGHSGNGAGGDLVIDAGINGTGDLNVNAALIADGNGNGAGGTLTANSNSGSATFNHPVSSSTSISATGGSFDGQNAKGGQISILAAGDLNLQSGDVDVSSLAQNGNGGTVVLSAGLEGSGALTYNQQIRANGGVASGNGGSISLSEASSLPIVVSGNIQADALGQGDSGHINYENKHVSADLIVNISGNVSANTSNGIAASNEFNALLPNQNVIINVLEGGVIAGPVTSKNGKSLTIETQSTSPGQITIGQVESGDVTINYRTGEIKLLENSSIKATGDVLLKTHTLDNAGTIESSGLNKTIKISSDQNLTIKGNGQIRTTRGGAFSGLTFDAGGDINVLSNSVNWSARGGDLFGDAGQINMTAVGNIKFQGALNPDIDASATAGGKGGAIHIQASKQIVLYGFLKVNGVGEGTGGTITINGANIESNGILELSANAGTKGDGGIIRVHATNGSIMLASNAGSNFFARGGTESGAGGDVSFTATQDITAINTQIDTSALKLGDGSAALGVDIKAANLLTFAGSIHADGKGSGTDTSGLPLGNGGLIAIESGLVNIANASFSATSESATGGTISIKVNASDFAADTFTSDVSASSSGKSGTIKYTVPNGNILLPGSINADGHGTASGGTIEINANNLIFLTPTTLSAAALGTEGNGGHIELTLRQANLVLGLAETPLSFAVQGASSSGDGGEIEIRNAGNLSLQGNAFGNDTPGVRPDAVASTIKAYAENNGKLTVGSSISVSKTNTSSLIELGASEISILNDVTLKAEGPVSGGNIFLTDAAGTGAAKTISFGKNIKMLAIPKDGGRGGAISMRASENITMGSVLINASGRPTVDHTGFYGNVFIDAGANTNGTLTVTESLAVHNGGETGAGDITINAAHMSFAGSTLTLEANGGQNANNRPTNGSGIHLESTQGDITLQNASITANGGLRGGNGGSISILAPQGSVTISNPLEAHAIDPLQNEGAVGGAGGKVTIDCGANLSVNKIDVTAASRDPVPGGTVTLTYSGTATFGGDILASDTINFVSNPGTITIQNKSVDSPLLLAIGTTLNAGTRGKIQFVSSQAVDVSTADDGQMIGILSVGSTLSNGSLSGTAASTAITNNNNSLSLGTISTSGAIRISSTQGIQVESTGFVNSKSELVTLTTSRLDNAGTISGVGIEIKNPTGDLVMIGGGSAQYTSSAAPSLIEISSESVQTIGNQKFNGNVSLETSSLTNSGGSVDIVGSLTWTRATSNQNNQNLKLSGWGSIASTGDLTISGLSNQAVPTLTISANIGPIFDLRGNNITISAGTIESTGTSHVSVNAKGALTLNSSTLSNVDYNASSIMIKGSGAIALTQGSFTATNGNVVLQNTSGTIGIAGTFLKATGTELGQGRIYILSGMNAASIPDTNLKSASLPLLVTATRQNGGDVYFVSGISPLTSWSMAGLSVNGSGIIFGGAPDSISLSSIFTNPTVMIASGPRIQTTTVSPPPGISGGPPPGQGGSPFGLGATLPPGLGGQNPGYGGGTPPGQAGANPSQSGNTPVSKFKFAFVDESQEEPHMKKQVAHAKEEFRPTSYVQVASALSGRKEKFYTLETPAALCKTMGNTNFLFDDEANATLLDGEVLLFVLNFSIIPSEI